MKYFLFFGFLITSCNSSQTNNGLSSEKREIPISVKEVQIDKSFSDSLLKQKSIYKSELEIDLIAAGLVNVHAIDSTIIIDLRYSTIENFVGIDVYGDFDACYLQPNVAEKLAHAQRLLKTKFPFYSLIVFDAVRPLHIQRKMWDTLVLPKGQKSKYLSNPENGSLHNYGAAVDVGIIDEHGILLDMGTPFDFFGDKAHPEKELELLSSGELTQRQVFNREILRSVMKPSGFFGIQTEWWHFNSCRREVAEQIYKIIE